MKKLIIILMSLTLLTACGEKKIDGSSIKNLNASVQEITQSLEGTEQQAFKSAIGKITLAAAFETKGNEDQMIEILTKKLNGKTAAEVIKIAEQEQNPLNKVD